MKKFIKQWLGEKERHAVKPSLPNGQRVYCIGDIHGQLSLLQQLHQAIVEDAASYQAEKTLVYLGDYIDRG